jgi:uncharacterized membrane protein YeaQ/YmgE (transglycosylase-associated protein family)
VVGLVVVAVVVCVLLGMALWALISAAIVGLVVGGLARLILPGRQNIGLFATICLGWLGSVIGGEIGFRVAHTGRVLTALIELGVAIVLVAIWAGWQNRKAARRAPRQAAPSPYTYR